MLKLLCIAIHIGIPHFSFLSQLLPEIWAGSQNPRWRRSWTHAPPSRKMFNTVEAPNHIYSTVWTVKGVELHYYAKFCRNPFNCGRDIAIFRYFKMAAAAILNFRNLIENGRNGQEGRTASLCLPNFVEVARTAAEICEFQCYASLAWKCLFTPLLGFFWGTFTTNDVIHRLNPKRTILGLNHWTANISLLILEWALQESSISHWFNITGPQNWVIGGFKYGGGKSSL